MDYLREEVFFSMDPAIKQRWIDDLRSGTVKQVKGYLHLVAGGMCCLGVLSWRAAEAGVANVTISNDKIKYDNLPGSLSLATCAWAGLKNDARATSAGVLPFTDKNDSYVYLDDLNDRGFTFDQIADLIECFY